MCYAFYVVACVSLTLMLYALHAYLFSSCAYCTWFCCLHDHVANLAHMPRLHYIGMHALPLELSMIEVEPHLFVWCASHLKSKCILGFLGHHALKYAIGGLRIENHVPLSHKHDKGCVGAHICLKYIAMPCFALCCCQNRFCRKTWPVDYMERRPTNYWWPRAQQMVDDHPDMVGGVSTWSVVIHSVHGAYLESCEIFRGAEQGKQRQTCAWWWVSERNRARIHWALFPRLLLSLN